MQDVHQILTKIDQVEENEIGEAFSIQGEVKTRTKFRLNSLNGKDRLDDIRLQLWRKNTEYLDKRNLCSNVVSPDCKHPHQHSEILLRLIKALR